MDFAQTLSLFKKRTTAVNGLKRAIRLVLGKTSKPLKKTLCQWYSWYFASQYNIKVLVLKFQDCDQHGDDFLEYKCRYCCSVAIYFCFGNTHFCEECHGLWYSLPERNPQPKCPVGPGGKKLKGKCPLGIAHPPTGEEFCLGCGLCSHMESF